MLMIVLLFFIWQLTNVVVVAEVAEVFVAAYEKQPVKTRIRSGSFKLFHFLVKPKDTNQTITF